MTGTLIVLLVLATFLLIIVAMLDDIDQLIEDGKHDEVSCSGCGRHYVKPGCKVHDPNERAA